MFAPLLLAAAHVLYHLARLYISGILARDRRWFRLGRPKEKLAACLNLALALTLTPNPNALTPAPYPCPLPP